MQKFFIQKKGKRSMLIFCLNNFIKLLENTPSVITFRRFFTSYGCVYNKKTLFGSAFDSLKFVYKTNFTY